MTPPRAAVSGMPPLTVARWLIAWSPDVPVLVIAAAAGLVYGLAVRRIQQRGGTWPVSAMSWFLAAGLGSLMLVTCSFLGTYSRVLFWPLAVQDVLLLTLVPVGLTLGRPVALWRAYRPTSKRDPHPAGRLVRMLSFPLTGSIVAVTLLLAIYTSGWDQARLEHPWLLAATRFVLLAAGFGYLWPLLGVDEGSGRTSYPVRAIVAFLDGLLDALPGLAVLGTGHVIAAGYYARVDRAWGPSPARAQQIGGTAMIALSELVGLPALLVLLLAWVRSDARTARDIDASLDVIDAAEAAARPNAPEGDTGAAGDLVQLPWWEIDAGPLTDRAARYGWTRAHDQDNLSR